MSHWQTCLCSTQTDDICTWLSDDIKSTIPLIRSTGPARGVILFPYKDCHSLSFGLSLFAMMMMIRSTYILEQLHKQKRFTVHILKRFGTVNFTLMCLFVLTEQWQCDYTVLRSEQTDIRKTWTIGPKTKKKKKEEKKKNLTGKKAKATLRVSILLFAQNSTIINDQFIWAFLLTSKERRIVRLLQSLIWSPGKEQRFWTVQYVCHAFQILHSLEQRYQACCLWARDGLPDRISVTDGQRLRTMHRDTVLQCKAIYTLLILLWCNFFPLIMKSTLLLTLLCLLHMFASNLSLDSVCVNCNWCTVRNQIR